MQKLLANRKQHCPGEHEDCQLNREEQATLAERARSKIDHKVLRGHRFYQFRLAFDKAQAKGSFKIMADEFAEKLEADIILPKSSVKPKYQGGVVRTIRSILGDRQAHAFRGSVLVGIRDVSRDLEFQSSYTLVEHAPDDSIELEIKPYALRQIERLRKAWEENNFTELFELLGTQEAQSVLDVGEERRSRIHQQRIHRRRWCACCRWHGLHAQASVREPSPAESTGSMGIPPLHQWRLSSSRLCAGRRWLPGARRRTGVL